MDTKIMLSLVNITLDTKIMLFSFNITMDTKIKLFSFNITMDTKIMLFSFNITMGTKIMLFLFNITLDTKIMLFLFTAHLLQHKVISGILLLTKHGQEIYTYVVMENLQIFYRYRGENVHHNGVWRDPKSGIHFVTSEVKILFVVLYIIRVIVNVRVHQMPLNIC